MVPALGASSLWEGQTGNKWDMLECQVLVIVLRKVGVGGAIVET